MASTTNDYRLTAVEDERSNAIAENEKLYGDMVNESDKYYQAQIDASKEWAEEQKKSQQEQTDFAIEKIEQQKDQTAKDYTKEQSGAYVDWQKESNRYGVNAEQLATSGMLNTGYGESSQVRIYNTYQNRVATARESYNNAILNYNNAIKDAQLQNNSILAEIAYKALQEQLELSLQGFQYKNQLLETSANKKLDINKAYDAKYQAVLAQINEENRLAEQARQFEAEQARLREQAALEAAIERERLAQQKAIEDARLAEEIRQANMEYEMSNSSSKAQSAASEVAAKSSAAGVAAASKQASTIANTTKSKAEKEGAQAFRDSISGTYLTTPTAQKAIDEKNNKKQASEAVAGSAAIGAASALASSSLLSKLSAMDNVTQGGRSYSSGSARLGGDVYVPTMTSYSQATSFMKENGAITSGDGGIMTKNEWQRSKNGGSLSSAAQYPTYEAYLTDYVDYKVNQSK